MSLTKIQRRQRNSMRVRGKISGTGEISRMSVFRSNKQIYVQMIDDSQGKTIIAASSREKQVADKKDITKIEQANLVGKSIADKCKEKGIDHAILDRSGYPYHGRVKSLAEGARENGLKI